MSTLGKVLAILNVLAAIAFFALAAMDYGQRKKWAHNVFVHDLAINGLPVDAEEPDADGDPLVNRFRDDSETLKEVFKSSGNPVKTQEDELARVQSRILQKVKDPNDTTLGKGTELQKLATALIPFADAASRRD